MLTFKSYQNVALNVDPQRCTIHPPIVVNGNIWYILVESHQKAMWMVYDVNTKFHSFVANLPNIALSGQVDDDTIYNYAVCDDKIYLFCNTYNHGPIVFDTKTKNYSIQIVNHDQYNGHVTPSKCIQINGNVYLFGYVQQLVAMIESQIYNISKQQFGEEQYLNDNILSMIYDDKQKQWIVITDHDFSGFDFMRFSSFKNINQYDTICHIARCSFSVSEYHDRYIQSGPDCSTFFYLDNAAFDLLLKRTVSWFPWSPLNVLYNNYIIITDDVNKPIFVLDLITGNSKILNDVKCPCCAYYTVIVDDANGMTQCIIKQYIERLSDNQLLFIPNDIQLLIEAFCGDYYDKTVHIFQAFMHYRYPYHFSISLGVIIDTFLKEQQPPIQQKEDDEKKKEEECQYDDIFDEMQRINDEKEVLIKEMMEKYKRLIEENLRLKNRLKMYEK